MIITRSPLRISLGGGGTDLPSYYRSHEGFVLSAAINRYIYVALNQPFSKKIIIKYSDYEELEEISNIKHPIVRESLRLFESEVSGIEISTMADIPSGTGLGSSGSFTTALLKALSLYFRKSLDARELAELACQIEINKLKEPIGKQDQYIAALGGITEFTFHSDERVSASHLNITQSTMHKLEDNLLLFYTGMSRSAGSILKHQVTKTESQDTQMLNNLHLTKEIGIKTRQLLLAGKTEDFGFLMDEHWKIKRSRSGGMSNEFIDQAYSTAKNNGAIGGKLVGAGGGGFLMFYAADAEKLRMSMSKIGLSEVRFQFDFEGTKVILS